MLLNLALWRSKKHSRDYETILASSMIKVGRILRRRSKSGHQRQRPSLFAAFSAKSSASLSSRLAALQLTGKFTRKHVAARIESLYPTVQIPTRSVAVEPWKLARDSEIETVKEGRGRTPATYKQNDFMRIDTKARTDAYWSDISAQTEIRAT
jgi:hypothetical protein